MARLTIGAALVCILGGTYAHAGQAEIAAQLNEDGKEAMFAGNYKDASAKFQDAVARVPEAKYFFNLCTSRYQEGKFGEALTACNSVEKNNADDKLKAKTAKLVEKIRDDAKQQGIDLQPTGGGGGDPNVTPDPNNPPVDPNRPPDPNVQPPQPPSQAIGRPMQNLIVATAPSHAYTWTLGVDFYFGGANVGKQGDYGTAAGGFRVKGDYMLLPAARVGAQLYLQITNLGKGAMSTSTVSALDIFDIGIAAYKHVCPAGGRFCLTPLAGVQLALMDPNMDQGTGNQLFNYTALGFRGEVNASYSFGSRYEYVVQAMLGVDVYTPVFASPSDCALTASCAGDLGLDRGGPVGYFGLGFTYRFNTPFGQAPFVTLE